MVDCLQYWKQAGNNGLPVINRLKSDFHDGMNGWNSPISHPCLGDYERRTG
ncbi:hypothetical protein AM1_5045 [Acaryochloris marina MBIC11017]|uniref:Uncharacterized protein n=1 Tax=Acaryochloris marina (strain MBIC 11017) TaxID=329726 RepID=B0C600_ACAM1|nr:hypothetical protein AM1_5045 [Acaryochloris marina MBIC11017]